MVDHPARRGLRRGGGRLPAAHPHAPRSSSLEELAKPDWQVSRLRVIFLTPAMPVIRASEERHCSPKSNVRRNALRRVELKNACSGSRECVQD